MKPDRIYQHEDWQTRPLREFITEQLSRNGNKPPPSIQSALGEVPAYVNHGRWVADCPGGDGGALCVTEAEPYFMCPVCANELNAGQWYRVVFPPELHEIERLLLARPARDGFNAATRNWLPGETPADLRRENHAMHLGEDGRGLD